MSRSGCVAKYKLKNEVHAPVFDKFYNIAKYYARDKNKQLFIPLLKY